MIKTKDFILFLVVVLLLLLGIVFTIFFKATSGNFLAKVVLPIPEKETTYATVAVPEETVFSRAENLKKMQALLESNPDLVKEMKRDPVFAAVLEEEEKEEEPEGGALIDNCPERINLGKNWSAVGATFETVAGVRELVQKDISLGTSNKIAWLPIRTTAGGGRYCLNSDVVGIAVDGSLIKNNEYDLYKIFSKETLIGYARDGFPIFGLNEAAKTDICGGVTENGQYRYYLSAERKGVLGCFSAEPLNSFGN